MSEYNAGKIYTIRSKSNPHYLYVGSTIRDLSVCLSCHKSTSKIMQILNCIKLLVEIVMIGT
jgi:hypothetical protein